MLPNQGPYQQYPPGQGYGQVPAQPPAQGYPAQGYTQAPAQYATPNQGGYPQAGGYPPTQAGYPPAQATYPPQPTYPAATQNPYPGYPPAQGGYPPPPTQGSYPSGTNYEGQPISKAYGGIPTNVGAYPPQTGTYPPGQYPPGPAAQYPPNPQYPASTAQPASAPGGGQTAYPTSYTAGYPQGVMGSATQAYGMNAQVFGGLNEYQGYTAYTPTPYNPGVCAYYLPQNKVYTDEEQWAYDPDYVERQMPYVDKEFHQFPIPAKTDYVVARAPEIHPKEFETELFVEGCGHDDITQGALGDCWLLSALVVLAVMRPKLVVKIFHPKSRSMQQDGFYLLRLWINGKRTELCLDDGFPVSRASMKPLFCKLSIDPKLKKKEIWAMLIEKGMAKGYGGYKSLIGGTVDTALTDLTGGGSIVYDLREGEIRNMLNSGELWTEMCHFADNGYLMGAGSHSGSDADINAYGIVQGHAYAILDCIQVDPYTRLVQLKNPWGETEWKGDWSDNSAKWQGPAKQQIEAMQIQRKAMIAYYDQEEYKHIPIEKKDDGIFWMSLEDFTTQFHCIYACKLFDANWSEDIFEDQWSHGRDGGCTNFDSVMHNPHYVLDVNKPTTVFIMLQQIKPVADAKNEGIGFEVYKNEGMLIGAGGKHQKEICRNAGGYTTARQVSLERKLEIGSYFILATTFNPHKHRPFVLKVWSLLDENKSKIVKAAKYNQVA